MSRKLKIRVGGRPSGWTYVIMIGVLLLLSSLKDGAEIIRYTAKWTKFRENAVSVQAQIASTYTHTGKHGYTSVYIRYTDADGAEHEGNFWSPQVRQVIHDEIVRRLLGEVR